MKMRKRRGLTDTSLYRKLIVWSHLPIHCQQLRLKLHSKESSILTHTLLSSYNPALETTTPASSMSSHKILTSFSSKRDMLKLFCPQEWDLPGNHSPLRSPRRGPFVIGCSLSNKLPRKYQQPQIMGPSTVAAVPVYSRRKQSPQHSLTTSSTTSAARPPSSSPIRSLHLLKRISITCQPFDHVGPPHRTGALSTTHALTASKPHKIFNSVPKHLSAHCPCPTRRLTDDGSRTHATSMHRKHNHPYTLVHAKYMHTHSYAFTPTPK